MCNQFNEQISINKKHIFDVVPNIYWSCKKQLLVHAHVILCEQVAFEFWQVHFNTFFIECNKIIYFLLRVRLC